MKKIILAACLAAITSVASFAQSTDEYKKGEVFVGYSNNQVDTGVSSDESFGLIKEREPFHGFNASGVYNVHRYVGLKADVSGTYNNKNFDFTVPGSSSRVAFDTNSSLYNFLGGVQVKDNSSEARFKPFAHALVGAGHGRSKVKNLVCPAGVDCSSLSATESETGLAGAFGGGLDIKVSDKVDFRAFQVDYNPIKFDSGTQHNVRIGIGIVFK